MKKKRKVDKISDYFTWSEALNLPKWKRDASEDDGLTDEIRANLSATFAKMDEIREFLNAPIRVHVAYRPPEYNKLVGGAKGSAHMMGMAVDWSIAGKSCDDVRKLIIDAELLNKLNIRMEDNPGSNWIHIDIRSPGASGRFFKP